MYLTSRAEILTGHLEPNETSETDSMKRQCLNNQEPEELATVFFFFFLLSFTSLVFPAAFILIISIFTVFIKACGSSVDFLNLSLQHRIDGDCILASLLAPGSDNEI